MKVDVKFAENAERFGVNLSESAEGFNVDFGDIKTLRGKSAYEIAVENGFEGTEEEWAEHFAEPLRTGRVPGETLDFFILCPLAEKEKDKEWEKSKLEEVKQYILEQM